MAERGGFEPPVAINYTAFPMLLLRPLGHLSNVSMERVMRFELTTLALARRCSTTELHPLLGYIVGNSCKWSGRLESNQRVLVPKTSGTSPALRPDIFILLAGRKVFNVFIYLFFNQVTKGTVNILMMSWT